MDAVVPSQPMGWSRAWGLIERALDRPAATALELESSHGAQTAALTIAGLGMIGAAGALSGALLPASAVGHQGEAAWAMLLAWGVSAPVLLVAAGHLGLAVRPRAMLGGLAVALVAAGIVALGTLPLLAYLAVVPHAGEHTCVARALLASVLALAAGVVVPGRVLRALDGSARASWVAHRRAGAAASSRLGG